MLLLAFFNKTAKFFIDLIFEGIVTIIEFFIVLDKDDLIGSFYTVKNPTPIHDIDMGILHLLTFCHLVDIIPSRDVLELQTALGSRQLLINVLVLVNVLKADYR